MSAGMQAPENDPAGPVIVPFPAHLAAAPPIVMEFKDGPIVLTQEISNQIRAISRENGGADEEAVIARLILEISREVRRRHPDLDLEAVTALTVESFHMLCLKQS